VINRISPSPWPRLGNSDDAPAGQAKLICKRRAALQAFASGIPYSPSARQPHATARYQCDLVLTAVRVSPALPRVDPVRANHPSAALPEPLSRGGVPSRPAADSRDFLECLQQSPTPRLRSCVARPQRVFATAGSCSRASRAPEFSLRRRPERDDPAVGWAGARPTAVGRRLPEFSDGHPTTPQPALRAAPVCRGNSTAYTPADLAATPPCAGVARSGSGRDWRHSARRCGSGS
jgi:hypothetical protein